MKDFTADRHFSQIMGQIDDFGLFHSLLDDLVFLFRDIEMKLYRARIFAHNDPPCRKSDFAVVKVYDHIVQHDNCREMLNGGIRDE